MRRDDKGSGLACRAASSPRMGGAGGGVKGGRGEEQSKGRGGGRGKVGGSSSAWADDRMAGNGGEKSEKRRSHLTERF